MALQTQRLVAGRYRLLAPLGAGAMGRVWRASDDLLGREVAVKEIVFPPGLSESDREVLRERTRREARAAAGLHHVNAVTVFDVVEDDGAPWLVMELVEARTLADVVTSDGPLSPHRTAEVGLALLGALEAAHQRGIVHRDVKPSNVLVRDDGSVVLTDFGIASSTGDASLTDSGLLIGSPAYISPERARGEPAGPEADLWALGATLFTSVEGRPPYEAGSALMTVAAVVTGEHAPYVTAGPLVPVLEGLLTKEPALRLDASGARAQLQRVLDRPPSAPAVSAASVPAGGQASAGMSVLPLGEVRREIADRPQPERPVGTAVSAGSAPLRLPPRPVQEPRRRRRLVPVAAAAGLLLAGGAGAYSLFVDREPDERAASRTPSAAPSTQASASPSVEPVPAAPPVATPEPVTAEPAPEPTPAPTVPGPPAAVRAASTLPPGWTTDRGGAGWTVALPPGYTQTRSGEYRQAGTGRTLRIETGQGQPDAVADRERQAAGFARRHPTYEQIRIVPADYRGYEAADWEFTYEGLHVINRVFVVDGTGHSLFFQTSAADFADARADFDGIAAAFRPVGR